MTEALWKDPADLADLAARFRRDGFVHVPGVLTPAELARGGAAVDEAVAARKRGDTRRLDEKTPYEQSFLQCQYIWEDFPGVRPLTFHPAIGEIAATLIGAARIRLWHDQALYKEAGGRETEAHTDQPYWPIAQSDTATVWIPLGEVDETSGCMGYVPGSHLAPAEFVDIFGTPGAGKALEAKFAATPPVFVRCQSGDVIFHHGSTVHMARANRSAATRRVYTAIYFRDGCTRGGERAHPSVDRDAIAVGAPIDGAATPIVWPLEDGRLPEPAPWPAAGLPWRDRAERLGIIPPRAG
ncbi:MAG TPA: phytanoyl-CoA dioxygenase family protein [Caulobacteraceae bacterium]|nr:phytanoyl-CoA dioxygenase family protein [Caulobacteraceae bacterium]